MFPWFWFWAPQVQLPWSGDVAQRIDPQTLFGSIPPEAGNGRIEQQAFAVASYGKQLGLITDLLLDVCETARPQLPEGRDALVRLQRIRAQIETLKQQEYDQLASTLAQQAQTLRSKRPQAFDQLMQQLQAGASTSDAAQPRALPAPRKRKG
jgi:hypothetical protein